MNIQARNLASRKKRGSSETNRSVLFRLWLVFVVVMLAGAGFFIANCKVAMAQELSATETAIAKVKTELHKLDREIENLRVRKEQLSAWEHVRDRIAYFRLPLRQASPEQTFVLVSSRTYAGDAGATATAMADNDAGIRYDYN